MTMRRYSLNIIFFLLMITVLFTCKSPLRDALELIVKDYSTPIADSFFSGISTSTNIFSNGSGIADNSDIIIDFSESMKSSSLIIGGSAAAECNGGLWSTNVNENDTLTISPLTSWNRGSGKTFTLDCNDLEGYPIIPISITFGVLDGIVYVHVENGSDDNPGTSDQPKADIHSAINIASYLYETADVYVAEGIYQFAKPIKITKRISLTGGFSSDDWDIRETEADWPKTGDLESSYPTELKSLYTSTGAAGEEPFVIYCADFEGDMTISGFSIVAGVGEGSTAILINNCSPNIKSNFIDGGKGLSSIGITAQYSSALIENNNITGGDFEYSTGIFNYLADVTIYRNMIDGGGGGSTSAIYNIDSSSVIDSNDIYAGDARDYSEAIIAESASNCIIRNNLINAGTAYDTVGIRIKSSSPVIQNNIINGGGASTLTDSMAEGLWIYSSSFPIIENNIIFTKSGTIQYAISQGDSNSTPQSVKNNNIYNYSGSMIYYINVDGESECTTIGELNLLLFALDNVDDDPDINWNGDLDFNVSSPIEVTDGGLDLSLYFTTDITGNTRTVSWSMGAYEKD